MVRQEPDRLRANQGLGTDGALPHGFVLDEQSPLDGMGMIEALVELERRNRVQMQAFSVAGAIGGMLAGFFVIWNIIWHTAHWVWKGRKQK